MEREEEGKRNENERKMKGDKRKGENKKKRKKRGGYYGDSAFSNNQGCFTKHKMVASL